MKKGSHTWLLLLASYVLAFGTSADADRDHDHSKGDDPFEDDQKVKKMDVCPACGCLKSWLPSTYRSFNCMDFNCMDVKKELCIKESDCEDCSKRSCPQITPATSETILSSTTVEGTEKHKQEDNNECDCAIQKQRIGVSVGVTVGLLFVGVVIGAVVTAVVCVCVPCLRMRTREKVSGRVLERKSILKEDAYQIPRDVDLCVTDNTAQPRTTTSNPTTPTAPVSSDDPDQDGYFALNEVSTARDSHTYTGLQSDFSGQQEPFGAGSGYESAVTQPRRGPNAVMSPVYQEFTDNVIRGNSMDNPNNTTENQPIKSTDSEDYAANHNYFVLEAQNDCNERPLSDHQYFVLEEQNGKQDTNENVSASDPNNHEYFVLKKEET